MFSVALQPDLGEQEETEVPKNRPKPNKNKKINCLPLKNLTDLIKRFIFLYLFDLQRLKDTKN